MKGQGTNLTHNIPKQYKDRIEEVLKSPTTVVQLADLETAKLNSEITHTTLSGTFIISDKKK